MPPNLHNKMGKSNPRAELSHPMCALELAMIGGSCFGLISLVGLGVGLWGITTIQFEIQIARKAPLIIQVESFIPYALQPVDDPHSSTLLTVHAMDIASSVQLGKVRCPSKKKELNKVQASD